MTGNPQILKSEHGHCWVRPAVPTGFDRPAHYLGEPSGKPGLYLSMADGSRWFHPFNGSAPVQVNEHNAQLVQH